MILFILAGCASVPITNRKQLQLVSEYEIIQSSKLAYTEFLEQNSVVSPYDERSILLKKVGESLAIGVNRFFEERGGKERVAGYDWEFNLVEGDEVNAFCMPGGKVAVYTGILAVSADEKGLAVVLSHEIAHAVAQHGRESVSQQVLAETGGAILSIVLSGLEFKYPELQGIIEASYGLSSNLGLLKFSRNHELEADKMGMVFMEYAGYDCTESISFWKRMKNSNSVQGPEFLSTHPTDEMRIMEIEAFVPVAKSYIR